MPNVMGWMASAVLEPRRLVMNVRPPIKSESALGRVARLLEDGGVWTIDGIADELSMGPDTARRCLTDLVDRDQVHRVPNTSPWAWTWGSGEHDDKTEVGLKR